jgi:tetratricopeptide (TPR) repeat protein
MGEISRYVVGMSKVCRTKVSLNELLRKAGGGKIANERARPPRTSGYFSRVRFQIIGKLSLSAHVSLCMIVRNEEANLPASLGAVRDLVDERVVVDTGSTDRTREVARQFGAQVVDFPWCDSFSAARNESLRHATGQWILWLDADDRIDDANRERLRTLLSGLQDENVVYMMRCESLPGTLGTTVGDHPRLFRRLPGVCWEYRVHEQVLPSMSALGMESRRSDVVIRHDGYCDPRLTRAKDLRNLRLLELDAYDRPDDAWSLYYLGQTLVLVGRPVDALPYLEKSLARSLDGYIFLPRLYTLLSQALSQSGRADEAWAICQAGVVRYPQQFELLMHTAQQALERNELPGAEAFLRRLLTAPAPTHCFADTAPELQRLHAQHLLAQVMRRQGRTAEAEQELRTLLAGHPDFLEGWMALAELYLGQQRVDALQELLRMLEINPVRRVEAAVIRARLHCQNQEFSAARPLLEQAIVWAPIAILPRVALVQVLLQQGSDWPAARRALQGVLLIDPGNTMARRNLAVLEKRGIV